MSAYINLLNHIKDIFEEDPNVSTILGDGWNEVDTNRKDIYPIVDIYVLERLQFSSNTSAIKEFRVRISVATVRDLNNESVNDKFWTNDNRHDNWSLTEDILSQAEMKMRDDRTESNITLRSATTASRLVYKKGNLLDGWDQIWNVEVPSLDQSYCPIIEILTYAPSNEASPFTVTDIDLNYNVDVVKATGTVSFYDSGDNLLDSFTESDMSVTNKNLNVDTSASVPLQALTTGTYYMLVTAGLVTFEGQESDAVTDKTALEFIIT